MVTIIKITEIYIQTINHQEYNILIKDHKCLVINYQDINKDINHPNKCRLEIV